MSGVGNDDYALAPRRMGGSKCDKILCFHLVIFRTGGVVLQAHDGILLEGKLAEYEAAFKAVDSGGNGAFLFMPLHTHPLLPPRTVLLA